MTIPLSNKTPIQIDPSKPQETPSPLDQRKASIIKSCTEIQEKYRNAIEGITTNLPPNILTTDIRNTLQYMKNRLEYWRVAQEYWSDSKFIELERKTVWEQINQTNEQIAMDLSYITKKKIDFGLL